jgi:hypothetical protein
VRHRSGGWGPPVQAGATGGDLGYARSEERRCFGHKEGLSSRCFGYGAVWGGEVGGRGARHITVRNSSKGGIRITGGSKERRTKVDEGRVPSVTRKNKQPRAWASGPQPDGRVTFRRRRGKAEGRRIQCGRGVPVRRRRTDTAHWRRGRGEGRAMNIKRGGRFPCG